ncbi:MAG: hypothetical protein JWP45_667 [Mucilaginibacter sp.]|nr:hypothetical protein [Mucilaginibacter sp.]
MDLVSHQMAIRFYAGEILITEAVTPEGKNIICLIYPIIRLLRQNAIYSGFKIKLTIVKCFISVLE